MLRSDDENDDPIDLTVSENENENKQSSDVVDLTGSDDDDDETADPEHENKQSSDNMDQLMTKYQQLLKLNNPKWSEISKNLIKAINGMMYMHIK